MHLIKLMNFIIISNYELLFFCIKLFVKPENPEMSCMSVPKLSRFQIGRKLGIVFCSRVDFLKGFN